jgi:hypothetical protein
MPLQRTLPSHFLQTYLGCGRRQWHFVPNPEVSCGEKLSNNKQRFLHTSTTSAQHKATTWRPGEINT